MMRSLSLFLPFALSLRRHNRSRRIFIGYLKSQTTPSGSSCLVSHFAAEVGAVAAPDPAASSSAILNEDSNSSSRLAISSTTGAGYSQSRHRTSVPDTKSTRKLNRAEPSPKKRAHGRGKRARLTLSKHLPRHGIELVLQLVEEIVYCCCELAVGICRLSIREETKMLVGGNAI
jgi:hypothetical protein